jgi:uncharacterized membrane protein
MFEMDDVDQTNHALPGTGPIDRRAANVVGNLLRGGVIAAAAVVLAGGVPYLARYGAFRGEPEALKSVPGIVDAALSLSTGGVIQLGLLMLIATPILRVIVAGIAFAVERDRLYVAVALIVLGCLLYSLLGGRV